jgi:hypothetical protein
MKLTLAPGDGDAPIDLEASALLLFVDETGHEEFADPSYPVFGLAGVAVTVTEYENVIAAPWRGMKDRLFHGRETPLHAADLKRPTQEQLAALSQFFRDHRFSRFAAVMTRDTKIPKGISPYHLAAVSLLRRIERSTVRYMFSSVALMVESSSRGNPLAEKYLGPYDKVLIREGGTEQAVPIRHFLLPKRLSEPGLELADFVAQASGRHTLAQVTDPNSTFRKDFAAIFHAVPREAVEFISIDEASYGDA